MTREGEYEGVSTEGRSDSRPDGSLDLADLPPLDQQAALRAIAWRLQQRGPTAPLLAWGVEDDDLIELERTLVASMGHLGAVFSSPHMRLRIVEHIDPVDRASRPARRAIPSLASRPRDWARRTVAGVEPHRVLNRRIESDLAIYENRLAISLLRRLLAYVRNRRRPLELFQTASTDFAEAKERAAWRVAHRSYDRWGEALKHHDTEKLSATLQVMRRLERQLSALRDAPLARGLAHYWSHDPPELVMTNLLREDTHYRHVARLWVALNRFRTAHRVPLAEQQSRFRAAARDFEEYCGALIIQALEQHVADTRVDVPSRGSSARATLRTGSAVVLGHSSDGAYSLTLAGRSLEFLPLYTSVTSGRARGLVTSAQSSRPTAVLYLDPVYPAVTPDDDSAWRINRFSLPQGQLLGLVPVAPSSLRSMERVGQVVTWHLLAASILEAAQPVTVPSSFLERPDELLIPTRGTSRFRLARPLSTQDLAAYGERTRDRARTVHGGPDIRRQVAQDAERLIADVELRNRHLTLARTCLVCQAEMKVHAGRDGRWEATCHRCDARAFHTPCPHCEAPLLGVSVEPRYPDDRSGPEWVTRWAGSAVVSQPCWSTPGAFICSACGQCGSPRPECNRCRVQGDHRSAGSQRATSPGRSADRRAR